MNGKVRLDNGCSYSFQRPWDGRTVFSSSLAAPLAVDTETEVVSGPVIPRMALATVSNGRQSSIVSPSQLPDFLRLHARANLAGMNVQFDFWVIEQALREQGASQEILDLWWRFPEEDRLHDVMLMDMLIRLGEGQGYGSFGDGGLKKRNLDEIARNYLGFGVDKTDPFRMRYAELIDRDWNDPTIEEGFWSYAVTDAIVTFLVCRTQKLRAAQLFDRARRSSPKIFHRECRSRYSLLSESIQVRASIVFSELERCGIHVDRAKAADYEARLRKELDTQITRLHGLAPELIKRKKRKGSDIEEICWTKAGRVPQLRRDILVSQLEQAARELDTPVPRSDGKKAGTSVSVKLWEKLGKSHPFVGCWTKIGKLSKLLGFFQIFHEEALIHPRYNILLKTGRTSCQKPNVQQIPRSMDVRSLFIPRPGHKFVVIDYSFIELVTLATICQLRYGHSELAKQIRLGRDPHVYTASMIVGKTYEETVELVKAEKKLAKDDPSPRPMTKARQASKAVNFGVPGGLGPTKLAAYAEATFGVDMSVEEAANLRELLTTSVYPEIGQYLEEDSFALMGSKLGIRRAKLLDLFHIDKDSDPDELRRFALSILKVLRGKPFKKDGTPYKPGFVERVWVSLEQVASRCRVPSRIRQALKERKGSREVELFFISGEGITPTGRIRGACTYTQARNSPFQGLAADGAKQAFWLLRRAGHRVVGFIHDEMIVEIPEASDEAMHATAREIESLMVAGMGWALDGLVPVKCEYVICDHWTKG